MYDVRGLIKEGVSLDRDFSRPRVANRNHFIDGDAGFLIYRGYPIEQLEKLEPFEVAICS